jgi:lipopolysaccharide transport system ATP-binding protein
MTEIVIKIDHLSKEYKLGVISHRTLYRDVQSAVSRIMKREDPNSLVGSNKQRNRGGKFFALDDISFDVRKGEIIGIIGKNGAGKSTLLKILSRVTTPTKGEIKVKGRIASLLEVGTGFHPELTGRENIFLNGAILGMTKKEIQAKLQEIIEFSGIEEFIETPVKRYSSGMYVRLAFAVAAHLDPDILIVDEVLAVGDIEFQKKCLGKISDVSKSGRTVLLVSHNMDAVDRICEKCIYLEQGKILKIGTTHEITSLYLNKTNSFIREDRKSDGSNKVAEFLKIYYTDIQLNEKSVFEYNEEILIHIEYVIKSKLKNTLIWFDIRRDGKVILASTDSDLDALQYRTKNKGRYSAAIKLESRFLNTGVYDLVMGINGYAPSVTYDRVENVAFKIVDSAEYDNPEFYERIGFIKPILKWNISSE